MQGPEDKAALSALPLLPRVLGRTHAGAHSHALTHTHTHPVASASCSPTSPLLPFETLQFRSLTLGRLPCTHPHGVRGDNWVRRQLPEPSSFSVHTASPT